MSTEELDPREELAALVDETRRHLQWMIDAGQTSVKKEGVAAPSFAAPQRATVSSRPSFMEAPKPAAPPPPPPRATPPPPPPAPVAQPVAQVAKPAQPPPAPVAQPVAQVAKPAQPPPAQPPVDPAKRLQALQAHIGPDCDRCSLCRERTKVVFGEGNPYAELVFVGEGPGEDEDKSGRPFVGRAGELLDKMIVAMGFTREQVYICNIVKCRPPGNRRPEPVEIDVCRPFVEHQLRMIKPKVIVALGATAAQALLRSDTSITRLRNQWTTWEGIPVMPTFHPSYLLRAPGEKAKAWDDLKLVVAKLGRQLPAKR